MVKLERANRLQTGDFIGRKVKENDALRLSQKSCFAHSRDRSPSIHSSRVYSSAIFHCLARSSLHLFEGVWDEQNSQIN